jgi:hypothetical protein
MEREQFQSYLQRFEMDVICQGFLSGVFGKKEMVTTRNGKLVRTDFGKLVGSNFEFSHPLAIDYYGHTKKSTGFYAMLAEIETQVRMIECDVVHFASIKIEDVVEVGSELVARFPIFKKQMLKRRGFKQ